MKLKKIIKDSYKNSNKNVLHLYIVLRMIVVLCMILQIVQKNYNNAFSCVLTLILFLLPVLVEHNFKIKISNLLKAFILIFIFCDKILGKVNCFYLTVPHFDTIMHTLNGFICCGVGFSLFELLNNNVKNFNLSPFYLTLVAFCFSMTIGVLWEFYEYGSDVILKTDMQKDFIVNEISSVEFNNGINKAITLNDISKTVIYYDNVKIYEINGYLDIGIHDTMKDLLVNLIGAITFSIFGYIHLNKNEKYKFTEKLYLKKID